MHILYHEMHRSWTSSISIIITSVNILERASARVQSYKMYRIMHVLKWQTVSALTGGLFWCLFTKLRSNEGNEHLNNTQLSAETVHHESTYITIFLSRHNESINDNKNDNIYTSSTCLTPLVFCLWRHNRLLMTSQWADICDVNTWIMISNSLDINYIHGDIHGWSCKKSNFLTALDP